MAIHFTGNAKSLAKALRKNPSVVPVTNVMPDKPRPVVEPVEKIAPKPAVQAVANGAGAAKQAISIRLDTRILEHYKAGGPGWQSRINADLLEIAQKK